MAEERALSGLEQALKYFRFDEFHWFDLVLMAAVPVVLLGYALLAWLLDRRARGQEARRKRLARLQSWLEAWALSPHELRTLRDLAGDGSDEALYDLLADTVRFETAVHQSGRSQAFLERIRVSLGHTSANAHTPIASTRQLLPGEHFRLAVWEEGRPQHHYGLVTGVTPAGLTLDLTEAGFSSATQGGGETELFYLRGSELEYRFPFMLRGVEPAQHRLVLAHQLVRSGQRPRGTRLPMVRPADFRLHTDNGSQAIEGLDLFESGPRPDVAPGQVLKGVLLEMSEGGFSLVAQREIAEGAYVAYDLPMPRGNALPLVGRVLDCRAFAGSRWLARCELRGLTSVQRGALGQALRLELQRRLRDIQAARRKRQRAESQGA